ncbi:LysR family transcriptional regulator [Actinoplanes derwentensis]|uniref:DNA-binding transcriptional regulator, LysR family n=1 Tax=Actinoplanes derwentensis TaxID=113562 RepID=A0A1H1UZ44_9ACTN|nr:LysR family transcriptional regulator [Actinoplanes derwentensis]GID89805.1 LysR family transcriptional regulator [Actinoplanes derwentensis]SDS77660.1 DNA-binding transcriptional regulator, LysR family [Actinoplanes derwentensis]
MDPHHLRLLRELGERGSVAAVARAMHITPSAVSQQLNVLQRSSPVPLTERRGRRLVLTAAGAALAAAAVEVMTALDRAARAVGEHLDDPDAPVTIAGFHSAGQAWFAPLILRAPGVRCSDADVAHADFPALVGDYDLVLAHRLAHSPPWPADRLTVVPIMTEPLYVAMSADHPLSARDPLRATDVSTWPWISVHTGFPLEGVLTAIAATAGRPLDVRHRINDFGVAACLVAAGDVLALLPGRLTVADPRLVLRPLADLPAARHIDVLARPETLHRAAVRTVLDTLREIIGAPGPTPPASR